MRAVIIAMLLLAAGSMVTARGNPSSSGRKLLKAYCMYPPLDSLYVPDSYTILSVVSTGMIKYVCNNSTMDPNHGEATATLRSDNGEWIGYFEYPVNGTYEGMPTYYLTNIVTNETRTIYGENKPQVKKPSPDGSQVAWSRRVIYGDISNKDLLGPDGISVVPYGPKATYVLRNETWDGGKPNTTVCNGDIDVEVPFTARHTFLSCDWWLFPPTAAPAPVPELAPAPGPDVVGVSLLAPVGAPIEAPAAAPIVEEIPSPSPVPLLVPPPTYFSNNLASVNATSSAHRAGTMIIAAAAALVAAVLA